MDFKLTFNEVPKIYDETRPTYVPELYRDIIEYSQIGRESRILEIGVGTGQATLPFLELGYEVTAIELGDNLASYTKEKFKKYKNFHIINSSFEDYECIDNFFGMIYSATAFHWIPEKVGYEKVYRLLKSGGTFARFRNHPYKDKDNKKLSRAIDMLYNEFFANSSKKEMKEFSYKDAENISNISKKYNFTDNICKIYKNIRSLDENQYTALLHTYSDHIALGEEKLKLFCDEIKKTISESGGKISIYDTIDLQLARKL